ncbi:MAG: aminotransferase class IV [Phycisphaerae bacterium]|nr:aminotransferase class IV [Phycisphaerae bacterium]
MALVWLNGEFFEDDDALVSSRDTGLLHAAGVFTTMRSFGGKTFRLAAHLHRLRSSCDTLGIPLPFDDDALSTSVTEILKANELSDARLRLTVTRGSARNDPQQGVMLRPTVLLTAAALEPYPAEFYERGMTVIALDTQKLNPYDVQAGHKTLNYFSRLTALREANRRGAGEALWFNVHNYLESGSISNVFIVKAGELLTPPTADDLKRIDSPYPTSAVLPGITRAAVIELAESAKVPFLPAALTINDLLSADEVFLTNSIMQIMPICRIERSAIGNDQPGPITRRLATLLKDAPA